ncbi:hypothetical protein [Synechococcus sp. MIT S9507]|uniref:hypothetical protein n=1 Tax=Synechococcus sp. MIT S9507 TaxID=3082544 RepID=UPI0039B5A446
MNDSPIRSYRTMRSEDGELTTVETTDWMRSNYFVNLQTLEEEEVPQEEEATAALSMKRARRKKLQHVSKEKPKPVGDEMVAKAQKKDLRRRRLE